MKLRPLQDRLTVRPTPPDKISPGGLRLPAAADDGPSTRGTVVEVGPDVLICCSGDAVVYSRHVGTGIVFDGEPLLVLRESDVLGVVGD
jgi:chaperonin GroES